MKVRIPRVTRREFNGIAVKTGASLTAPGVREHVESAVSAAKSVTKLTRLSSLGAALDGLSLQLAAFGDAWSEFSSFVSPLLEGRDPVPDEILEMTEGRSAVELVLGRLTGTSLHPLGNVPFQGLLSKQHSAELDRRLEQVFRSAGGLSRILGAVAAQRTDSDHIASLMKESSRLGAEGTREQLVKLLQLIKDRGWEHRCSAADLEEARKSVEASDGDHDLQRSVLEFSLTEGSPDEDGLWALFDSMEAESSFAAEDFLRSQGIPPDDFCTYFDEFAVPHRKWGKLLQLSRHQLTDFHSESHAFSELTERIVGCFGNPQRIGGALSQQTAERVLRTAKVLGERYAPKPEPERQVDWFDHRHRDADSLAISDRVAFGNAQAYLDIQLLHGAPLLPSESGFGNDIY